MNIYSSCKSYWLQNTKLHLTKLLNYYTVLQSARKSFKTATLFFWLQRSGVSNLIKPPAPLIVTLTSSHTRHGSMRCHIVLLTGGCPRDAWQLTTDNQLKLRWWKFLVATPSRDWRLERGSRLKTSANAASADYQ